MQVSFLSLSKAVAQCTYSWQKTVRADANALSLCVRRCSPATDKLRSEKAATRALSILSRWSMRTKGKVGGLDANRFHRNMELMFSSAAAARKGSRPKDYLAKKKLYFRVEQQSVCKVNIWPNTRMFQHTHNLGFLGFWVQNPTLSNSFTRTKLNPAVEIQIMKISPVSSMNLSSAESARMASLDVADVGLVNRTCLIVDLGTFFFIFFSFLLSHMNRRKKMKE